MNDNEMSKGLYLITLWAPLGTLLVIFAMKYISAAFSARARLAEDTAYRKLAEQTMAQQTENQYSLMAIQAELAKIAAGLAAVETILKQVE